MEVTLSALRIGRALLPINIIFLLLVFISIRGLVNLGLEGLGKLKNSFTSLGLEPATFRLVA
jgi:hypothetical protein